MGLSLCLFRLNAVDPEKKLLLCYPGISVFSAYSAVIPDRAVHMAAKALSFSLFMMLKQGHSSRIIRAPPMKSRVRYRLSATMHNHRTPGMPRQEREGGREAGRNELCCLIIP